MSTASVERSKSSALAFFIDGSKTRYTERRKIKRGRVGTIVGGGGEVRGYSNKIDDSQFERGPVSLLSIHSPLTIVSVCGFDRISSTFLENALCVGEMGHQRLYSLKLQLGWKIREIVKKICEDIKNAGNCQQIKDDIKKSSFTQRIVERISIIFVFLFAFFQNEFWIWMLGNVLK